MISPYVLAFFLYFLVLLTIGILSHRKQTSSADFIVGNRTLNFWLTALTAHASDMSSWLFMAFPAALFVSGLSEVWIAVGLVIGMFLNWHFIAEKLRIETEKYNSFTLSAYFERRFGDNSGIIRTLSATVTLFFETVYLASGLIAMGLLFDSLFGIDYYLGISIATGVVVIYTFMGGFITVAWTDFYQGIFLLISLVAVPILAFQEINGFREIFESSRRLEISQHILEDFSFHSWLAVLFTMSWGLGYFGQPHIVTKFMGIKNARDIPKSKYLGISWQIITLGSAAAVGLIGIPFFEPELIDPEIVFIEMVKALFNPFVAGFILCGIVAAVMSTMDSQLLVSASVLAEDIYKQHLHRHASPADLLRASRISLLLIASLSLSIAFMKSTTIMEVVRYAWDGLGASFGPVVISALYSKSTTREGAIAGIITGGLTAAIWPLLNPIIASEYNIPSILVGFLISFLSIFCVSKLTAPTLTKSS